MQAILDMVRMIAVFYLLEQMVLQLIPGERYERYVRFYLGLLLVLLLLQPVFQIFRLSEQLDQKVFLPGKGDGGDAGMKEKWEALRKKYWPPGKDQFLIMALCGLLLAVIAVPVDSGKEKGTQENNGQETETQQETDSYEEKMEKKLEELLSRVEGVGQVRVMLTFEGSGERKVEKDKQVGTGGTEEETVYEESGSSSRRPYVTSESNPQVEGVLVIAEGGDKSSVKEEIIGAAQALFGIEPHKIKIMKMEVEETK